MTSLSLICKLGITILVTVAISSTSLTREETHVNCKAQDTTAVLVLRSFGVKTLRRMQALTGQGGGALPEQWATL